jgi:hypothetical protein
MGETASSSREAVVGAISLALAHSKLTALAAKSSLEDILAIEYRDIAGSGALDLQVVWDILAEHEEFDAAEAVGPMCVLKSWESRFGCAVAMPAALAEMTHKDIVLATTACNVPGSEATKVFRRAEQRTSRSTQMTRDDMFAGDSMASQPTTWRDRREVGWIFGGLALASLLFIGYSVWTGRGGAAEWSGFDGKAFVSDIPIKGAEQFGAQVGATLDDDSWLMLPHATRVEHMQDALRALEPRDVNVFFVKDSKGRVRATVQWFGNPRRPAVELR